MVDYDSLSLVVKTWLTEMCKDPALMELTTQVVRHNLGSLKSNAQHLIDITVLNSGDLTGEEQYFDSVWAKILSQTTRPGSTAVFLRDIARVVHFRLTHTRDRVALKEYKQKVTLLLSTCHQLHVKRTQGVRLADLAEELRTKGAKTFVLWKSESLMSTPGIMNNGAGQVAIIRGLGQEDHLNGVVMPVPYCQETNPRVSSPADNSEDPFGVDEEKGYGDSYTELKYEPAVNELELTKSALLDPTYIDTIQIICAVCNKLRKEDRLGKTDWTKIKYGGRNYTLNEALGFHPVHYSTYVSRAIFWRLFEAQGVDVSKTPGASTKRKRDAAFPDVAPVQEVADQEEMASLRESLLDANLGALERINITARLSAGRAEVPRNVARPQRLLDADVLVDQDDDGELLHEDVRNDWARFKAIREATFPDMVTPVS